MCNEERKYPNERESSNYSDVYVCKKDIIKNIPDIKIFENKEPSIKSLKKKVIEAEKAGLNVKGVTNSEGAEIGWNKSGCSPWRWRRNK